MEARWWNSGPQSWSMSGWPLVRPASGTNRCTRPAVCSSEKAPIHGQALRRAPVTGARCGTAELAQSAVRREELRELLARRAELRVGHAGQRLVRELLDVLERLVARRVVVDQARVEVPLVLLVLVDDRQRRLAAG